MKTPNLAINRWRIREGPYRSKNGFGNNGAFRIPGPQGQTFFVIASDQDGWDHASASLMGEKRCPTWDEMCFVKGIFWGDDECVIQYHPPKAIYINCYNYVLHLWRPQLDGLPMPPLGMV